MLDSCENSRTDLYSAALMYLDWGWSVLPVRGDSDQQNPKAAAVKWSAYKQRKPSVGEIESWFSNGRFLGLGIVCGRVSQLAVLDFDDADCASAFSECFPDLVDTFTVESGVRGLPHYYFHVPGEVQVRGQRIQGADFQFEGAYVVGPPTRALGKEWQVVNEVQPYALSQGDVGRITRFLSAWQYVHQEDARLSSDISDSDLEAVTLNQGDSRGRLRGHVLLSWYRRLAKAGRNMALFRVACLARDSGWSRVDVQSLMLDVHVVQPSATGHQAETPEQRRFEGLQTINSAFRYAVRPYVPVTRSPRGLPNSVREALLQAKHSSVARVLDGLRLAGIQAGRMISERVVCQLLRVFDIGRRSVQAALKASFNGRAIFESPLNPPKDNACAAIAEEKEQKKCLFVTGANRVKSGRPARQYIIPDNQKLYRLFNIRPSASDLLAPEALRSPDAYRQALQRALIERRPGLYSRRWMSARLGISVWTCRRYDRQIGLKVASTYFSKRISWANIEHLPAHAAPNEGIFLETPDGRRYPPVQGLARRLLQNHAYLLYKRQHWNYYSLNEEYYENSYDEELGEPAKSTNCEEIHKLAPYDDVSLVPQATWSGAAALNEELTPEPAPSESEMILWVCPECMQQQFGETQPGRCPRCSGERWEAATAAVWRDPAQCRTWWQGLWQAHQKPTIRSQRPPQPGLAPTQRKMVEALYSAVCTRTPGAALTYGAARQLVLECGEVAVERALKLLDERRNIYNAAGFIISVLRGVTGHSDQRQAASYSTSHADWLTKLRQSPYASFYANEI